MAGSATALGKLALGTADPTDTAMNFKEFDPGVTRELLDANGTRGVFFLDGNRMLENRVTVNPKLSTEPTTTELDYLLSWAWSGVTTGTTTKTYVWSNTAATRYMHFKPVAGEEWFLSGCGVDTMTMRATSGEALGVDLDIVGQTYDDTRSNFPSVSYDQTKSPFLLSNLALTIDGTAVKCREFTFTINNGIDRSRYLNSLTLTAVQKLTGGLFPLSVDVPSGDNSGIWKKGISGCALSAVFTHPVTSAVLTITIADIRFPAQTPSHPFQGEGFVRVAGQAVRASNNSTNPPVSMTLLL